MLESALACRALDPDPDRAMPIAIGAIIILAPAAGPVTRLRRFTRTDSISRDMAIGTAASGGVTANGFTVAGVIGKLLARNFAAT